MNPNNYFIPRHVPLSLLFSLLLFSAISCKAQKGGNPKAAKEHYQKGEFFLSDKKYDLAIIEYKKCVELDKNMTYAYYALGDCYAAMKDVENGKKYYELFLQQKPGNTEVLFALGLMMKDNMHYEEAAPYFEKFLANETGNENLIMKARKYERDCKFAAEAIKHPVEFTAQPCSDRINTRVPEYFPSVSADEQTLIFSRLVNFEQEDIYITHKTPDNQWTNSLPISNLINTRYNEGALCISSNGQYIFYSSNKPDENYGSHDIYFSYLQGNVWSKPFNAGPKINSKYWDSHPSLSADGRTLYWLSTRPGGLGSEDIWYSTLDSNDKWTDARNLGPAINTPYREFTPFIYADGNTLFFSSEGHPGMGGLDIFYSRKNEKGEWGTPVNLGYAINTPNTESGFVLSANGRTAYYAREDANEHNNIDIYTFELYKDAQPGAVAYLKGTVTDIKTGKIVAARIQLIDLETGQIASQVQNNSTTGEYLICLPPSKNYALNVSADSYLFYSENFSLKVTGINTPMQKDVQLKPIVAGESVVLNNIFFETNKSDLKPESMAELNKVFAFLKTNGSVKLEISGHTDNTGDKVSNQKLSESRAKAVVSYLVQKGVDASRLTSKGYGDQKPVVPNTTVENKAKNRRTEMKIL